MMMELEVQVPRYAVMEYVKPIKEKVVQIVSLIAHVVQGKRVRRVIVMLILGVVLLLLFLIVWL